MVLSASTEGDLRTIPFARDYWHVVSDKHASIVGSLMKMHGKGDREQKWRAEFSGTMEKGWKEFKVDYFSTEEEALSFLRDALEDEEALDE